MHATHPVFAFIPLLFIIATAFCLQKIGGAPSAQGRFAGIDGLRGYLATFVFIHHASIWHFYLQTGQWTTPASALYTNLGQASVVLFFMITGFLFYNKLLDSRVRRIDWGKFFVSRSLRLGPLYMFMLICMWAIVAYQTLPILNEPILVIFKSLIKWLSFTILGDPDLNRFPRTFSIVAGVTWSLPYEWFFYFSLPVLALTVGTIAPRSYILLGLAGICGAYLYKINPFFLLAFGGGIVASCAVRVQVLCRVADSAVGSLLALGCIGVAVLLFESIENFAQMVLLSIALTLIAAGASLFGSLTSAVSRTLGEMAYSIYLLHGILLFVVINYAIGNAYTKAMSATSFWMLITAISPILIILCRTTCHWIELPAMQHADMATARLRAIRDRVARSLGALRTSK